MRSLVQKESKTIGDEGQSSLKNFVALGAVLKAEYYEMSVYSKVRALAEALDFGDVASLLQATLDEEDVTQEIPTTFAEELLPLALEHTGSI